MSRQRWIAASVLSLALVVAPLARAAKPQPPPAPPRLVSVVSAALHSGSCTGFVAIDSYGRVFVTQCYAPGFVLAAQLPGVPVSLYHGSYGPPELYVGMANGDIYGIGDTRTELPWSFSYQGNVFASGAAARASELAPLDFAPPILTGDGAAIEPEGTGVVK